MFSLRMHVSISHTWHGGLTYGSLVRSSVALWVVLAAA